MTDNAVRGTLVDYGIPNFDLYEEEYSKIGVSRADYNMWFSIANRGDRALLTNEKYRDIINIRENVVVEDTPKSEKIIDAIYALLSYQKTNTMFYFFFVSSIVFSSY